MSHNQLDYSVEAPIHRGLSGSRQTHDIAQALSHIVDTLLAYIDLTKPRIIALLLVTTVGAMVIAGRGLPPLGLILATVAGGSLAAGGASAINCYFDRDIDALMRRTRRRPIPSGRITPTRALIFGIALVVLSFLVLIAFTNPLSALLAMVGVAYYLIVYTLWLKRRTPQNIVIGGGAGAIPPLVGWTAVTNELGASALLLFAIIFFWTPPHFWAFSLLMRSDYERARVPMLPVVLGIEETKRQILIYSIILIAVTLLPYATGMAGLTYLGVAIVLGLALMWLAWQLNREPSQRWAAQLFGYSIAHLALLFTALAIDRALL